MNKNYFKYLINHYKVLFLFICLAEIIISILSPLEEMGAEILEDGLWAISMLLTFIFPALLFKHAQNKKEADTYFALPIHRKEILITSLVVSYLFIILPTTVIYFYLFISAKYALVSFIYPLLVLWISIAALLIFNSGVYLVANNEMDGVIILLAYHFIPVILMVLEESLNGILYYGYYASASFFENFSLINIGFNTMDNMTCNLYNHLPVLENINLTVFLLVSVFYILIGIISLRNNYLQRKVERAGSISNRISAYPMIIYTFTTIILLSIAFSTSASNISYFTILSEDLFSFALVIILFIVATFVYKRKITISIKSIVYFVIIALLGVGITLGLYKNEGLKKSYDYDHSPEVITIEGTRDYYSDEIKNTFKTLDCDEVDINFTIEMKNTDSEYEEMMSLFNSLRDENIHEHFSETEPDYGYYLYISEGNDKVLNNYYSYNLVDIDLDDLDKIAKYSTITVTIYSYNNEVSTYNQYTYDQFIDLLGGNING